MALGALISGGMGIWNMMQGSKKATGIGNNQPTAEDHRKNFSGGQGLIDRMTNFGQYSGPGMDLASQEGNQAVESSMMMGMGGSQANAIKNRMKKSAMGDMYGEYNKGLGTAAALQGGIDEQIFGQMNNQQNFKNQIGLQNADMQMGIGQRLMPEGGIRGLLGMGMSQFGIKK